MTAQAQQSTHGRVGGQVHTVLASLAVAVLAASGGVVCGSGAGATTDSSANRGSGGESDAWRAPAGSTAGTGNTTFRVATFNVLGARHTSPRGDKPGWPDARSRMAKAVRLLLREDIDVIGFQEFTITQIHEFERQAHRRFTVWPAGRIGRRSAQDSVAWRNDTWSLIHPATLAMHYFMGHIVRMPVVLLRNKLTGHKIYFANFHHPATTARFHHQTKWRVLDKAGERRLGRAKQAMDPPMPVVMTGDMNERRSYFCDMTAEGIWHAAYGGSNRPYQSCVPPRPTPIDWIMGTPEVTYTDWTRDATTRIQKISDHPLFFADASVAPEGTSRFAIKPSE